MMSKRPRLDSARARESLVVVALTLVGGVIRLWSPGRLGLVHFDEGIYAMAGQSVLSPRGFQDLESVIAYAPPGFPVMVGLSYFGLGVGDVPAILVSIVTGTLTIPAAAWLARRTFGTGAGGAAAAFAALSGPHVAYSRMALVDASFLLVWLVAIGQGQRFLERPNPARACALGLAVGAAQLLKYSGWISGAIVVLTAAFWLFVHPSEWRSRRSIATWAWGAGAALVATAVYWPWYQFVESHGGYAALLKHHQGYLAGIASWPGHLYLQLAQSMVLSGGPVWLAAGGFAAALGLYISAGEFAIERRILPRMLVASAAVTALCLIPFSGWWVVASWILLGLVPGLKVATRSACALAIGWVLLSALTPFYHPYARLWLPIHAFSWLVWGGVFVWVRSRIEVWGRDRPIARNRSSADPLPWLATAGVVAAAIGAFSAVELPWHVQYVRLLGPTDSLRSACQSILTELPKDVESLRVFARPPVTFYLGSIGRTAVFPQPSLDRLLLPADPRSWAVLDLAMLRQNGIAVRELDRLRAAWVPVRDYPTTLSGPTLLDLDPLAGRGEPVDLAALAALRLLRPKRRGDP
jgi:4-amino-4-deoxy-L-arabinose transferase-like glycosyltransferase